MRKFWCGLLFAACLSALCAAEGDGWSNIDPGRKFPAPAKLLWEETFLNADDLIFECRAGAKGKMELLPGKDGRGKLRIIKSNDHGYIVVTSKKVLNAPLKSELQSVIYTECADADTEYTPAFIRMYGKKENLAYFKGLDVSSGGGPKMKLLTNTPPGMPDRKLCHYIVTRETGNGIHGAIVVAGRRSTSLWSRWTIEDYRSARKAWNERYPMRNTAKKRPGLQDLKTFRARLAREKQHTSQLKTVDGAVRLLIDGKIVPPALYHGIANHAGAFWGQSFDRSGIHLQCMSLRLDDTPRRPGIWKADGTLDVKAGADEIERNMRSCPDSVFWLSLNLAPYRNFVEDHPDEAWVLPDGRKVYGHHVHVTWDIQEKKPANKWYWASMYSTVLRDSIAGALKKLVAELKARNLDKRIVGIHLRGFHDSQFSTRKLDYGIPVQKGFPRYLEEKYGTPEALSKAWGRKIGSFAEVKLPVFGQQEMLRPGADQDQIDFLAYLKVTPFRQQEYWAHTLREAFGKPVVIARWCQSAWGGNYVCHYDIDAFLASREVDILISQPGYSRRIPGVGCGYNIPYSSFAANNKMWLAEFDLRTYGGRSGDESELRVTGLSQATDDTMWCTLHRKMAGMSLALGDGFWYLDMAADQGGWFRPKGIMEDIVRANKFHQHLLERPVSSWHPDVALVGDEPGMLLNNLGAHYYTCNENMLKNELHLLSCSGVPYDFWSLRDFLRQPELARKYKVILFWGLYHIDAPRKKLLESLQNSGRILVYHAGAGCLGGAETTGFQFDWKPRPAGHLTFSCDRVNQISQIAIEAQTNRLGKKIPPYHQAGRFSVKLQPGDKVRSRFSSDKRPAAVERKHPQYTAVYLGEAGGLTPEYLLELTRRAHAYSVCDTIGLQANVSGNFLSLHALSSGKRLIRLPRKAVVKNVKTGKETPGAVTEFPLVCEAGSTYWFELK